MAKGMTIRGDNELELMIQLIPEDIFSRLHTNGSCFGSCLSDMPISALEIGTWWPARVTRWAMHPMEVTINGRAMRHNNGQFPQTAWRAEGILQRKIQATQQHLSRAMAVAVNWKKKGVWTITCRRVFNSDSSGNVSQRWGGGGIEQAGEPMLMLLVTNSTSAFTLCIHALHTHVYLCMWAWPYPLCQNHDSGWGWYIFCDCHYDYVWVLG